MSPIFATRTLHGAGKLGQICTGFGVKYRKFHVLGVDDWSWKKGRRYGTILVDLQRHKMIDLLQDRKSETFAQWLREHPEVDIISRDRGTDYAAAAREAPPID